MFGKTSSQAQSDDEYLSLCNLIVGCIPTSKETHFAQAQIYPNFDYLWRYNIHPKLWPMIRPIVSYARKRLSWGRLYIHSDFSQTYSVALQNDKPVFEVNEEASRNAYVQSLMAAIRGAVNHQGFYIPPIHPIRQWTNSHYASSLPFGGTLLNVPSTCEVMPGIFLCDSSVFPDSPSVSPTFTIMANACRVAEQALSS